MNVSAYDISISIVSEPPHSAIDVHVSLTTTTLISIEEFVYSVTSVEMHIPIHVDRPANLSELHAKVREAANLPHDPLTNLVSYSKPKSAPCFETGYESVLIPEKPDVEMLDTPISEKSDAVMLEAPSLINPSVMDVVFRNLRSSAKEKGKAHAASVPKAKQSASRVIRKATLSAPVIQETDSKEDSKPIIPILLNAEDEKQWSSML
nr:hypothetical protein Iba_chr09eCG11570 [Ipomoea batatas]